MFLSIKLSTCWRIFHSGIIENHAFKASEFEEMQKQMAETSNTLLVRMR